jgi:sigma-B regulation protein RsbU (phosphoserine phosphatase)
VITVLAGHHQVPVANLSSSTPLRILGKAGMAMGLTTGERFRASLRPTVEQLSEGDVLLLYTDGVEEAPDADGLEFGRGATWGHLLAWAEAEPQELVDSLAEAVAAHAGGSAADDVTCLALAVPVISDDEDDGIAP